MPEEILKALAESKKLKEKTDELFDELLDSSDENSEFDTQHVESLLQAEVACLIMQTANLGLSFAKLCSDVIAEMSENRPDLYEELLARNVL